MVVPIKSHRQAEIRLDPNESATQAHGHSAPSHGDRQGNSLSVHLYGREPRGGGVRLMFPVTRSIPAGSGTWSTHSDPPPLQQHNLGPVHSYVDRLQVGNLGVAPAMFIGCLDLEGGLIRSGIAGGREQVGAIPHEMEETAVVRCIVGISRHYAGCRILGINNRG